MSHTSAVQNAKPLIYPVKLETDITIAQKTEELCNTLGYYLVTGQIVGTLRVITNLALYVIHKIAFVFAQLVCSKRADEFDKRSEERLQQIKRGLLEFIPFGGRKYYQASDEKAIKERKMRIQDEEARLNHQLFLQNLNSLKKASPHELKAMKNYQRVVAEIKDANRDHRLKPFAKPAQ